MAGTVINFEHDDNALGARKPAQYVAARVLAAAGTAEQVTVPALATHAIINVSANTFFKYGSNPTAATPTDDDVGDSNELIRPDTPVESRTFRVTAADKFSFVSDTNGSFVTVSFYKQ